MAVQHPAGILRHSDDMPNTSQLVTNDGGFDAGAAGSLEDVKVLDSILPRQTQDLLKAVDVEHFKLLAVSSERV